MKCKKAAVVVAGLLMALGTAAPAMADAEAEGFAIGSPGVLSGNVIQVPVELEANVCGDSIDILALLNPAGGTFCFND
ncbi:chaplin [Streptomyces sp. NPDC046203]|uniref:chaplin n=1 Tax=Streptomyces sp. NPDC046203 TaxID=3154602 RepID=UPI00340D7750